MFLLVSVILSTGGGSASVHAGMLPPPHEGGTPQEGDTPCQGGGPPHTGKQTPAYGQWAAGTHPTGMHSWFFGPAILFTDGRTYVLLK